MRNGELQYLASSGWETLSTEPTTGEWVFFEIRDIDVSAETYSVEWFTPDESGSVADISFANSMIEGYKHTILDVNNEAYWDSFGIGG